MDRLRIFTWHVHGTYLYYLAHGRYTIYLPINRSGSDGYIGRGTTFPFGKNVLEVPVGDVRDMEFDCILFQNAKTYLHDQYQILSEEQRKLPKIFLEHDPPMEHPTDTLHVASDPSVTLVHVTHYNKLMWDSLKNPGRVIDHGIPSTSVAYKGDLKKGIVVINNLAHRGRKLGLDIFERVRKEIPLDLIGLNTHVLGGMGEILHPKLPAFLSHYRFFFNPIRYTSLGLAVLEAMTVGVPVVGLATTEMSTVFKNGDDGFVSTDVDALISAMHRLLEDRDLAMQVGARGKAIANTRFSIERFVTDWEQLFKSVCRSYVNIS